MNYSPLTDADRQDMFSAIGVKSFDDLIANIPLTLRGRGLNLPQGLSEFELRGYFEKILSSGRTAGDFNSFLGAGSYDHYIPAVVPQIVGRGEFVTAYTPYQAEASQGTLQAIFEYQSMMAELTGLEVANGSHYDGATAFAEGILLALRTTQRKKALIARTVHPEYRAVAATYLAGTDHTVEEIPYTRAGGLDLDFLKKKLSSEVGCVAVSNPNFFGMVENLTEAVALTHGNQSLFLMTGHPLSFSVFCSPGEWGADMACGEAQPLGLGLNFGGPYIGYFAASHALMRKIPGRLVGLTTDRCGKRAFVLTLQAREQHIRREKASSNICSNQALCALAVCVYLSSLGWDGIREVASLNIEKACKLRDQISKLREFEIPFGGTVFNEFVVRSRKPLEPLMGKLFEKGILAGHALEKSYPELKDHFLVTVTEKKTDAQMLEFTECLRGL